LTGSIISAHSVTAGFLARRKTLARLLIVVVPMVTTPRALVIVVGWSEAICPTGSSMSALVGHPDNLSLSNGDSAV
jgi:hypothetical protein